MIVKTARQRQKRVILIVVVALVCFGVSNEAQAWASGAASFPYLTQDGKIWDCYPFDGVQWGDGMLYLCFCTYRWGSGYGQWGCVGYHWMYFEFGKPCLAASS